MNLITLIVEGSAKPSVFAIVQQLYATDTVCSILRSLSGDNEDQSRERSSIRPKKQNQQAKTLRVLVLPKVLFGFLEGLLCFFGFPCVQGLVPSHPGKPASAPPARFSPTGRQDGVAGAAASFKEGAAHAFDVTGACAPRRRMGVQRPSQRLFFEAPANKKVNQCEEDTRIRLNFRVLPAHGKRVNETEARCNAHMRNKICIPGPSESTEISVHVRTNRACLWFRKFDGNRL